MDDVWMCENCVCLEKKSSSLSGVLCLRLVDTAGAKRGTESQRDKRYSSLRVGKLMQKQGGSDARYIETRKSQWGKIKKKGCFENRGGEQEKKDPRTMN